MTGTIDVLDLKNMGTVAESYLAHLQSDIQLFPASLSVVCRIIMQS